MNVCTSANEDASGRIEKSFRIPHFNLSGFFMPDGNFSVSWVLCLFAKMKMKVDAMFEQTVK